MKHQKILALSVLKSTFIVVFCAFFVLTSCKNDDDNSPNGTEGLTLEEIAEAMGGIETINNVKTMSFSVKGNSYEYEQDIPTLPSPLTSNYYVYDFYTELNARKMRMDYDSIHFNHPAYYDTKGPLFIVNDRTGSVSRDFIWKSYYLGVTDPHGIFSTEIEANIKNQKMANPIELIREIASTRKLSDASSDNSFSIPTRVDGLDIRVEFDPKTALPIRAVTREADFLKGDVSFEVVYENWIEIAGTKFPTKIEYILDNEVFKSETLSNIELNPQLSADTFTPEAVPADYQIAWDEEQADFGIYHSQFYHRWNAWNIGYPEPVNNGAIDLGAFDLSQFGLASQYIGENVKIIGRPDNRLWIAAINTPEGVIIVDSPLNQKWTRSLINATKNAYPGKDIIAVISTHAHHDHFAGIREAAQEAGKVYIAEESVPFLNQVLTGTHEIYPDNLAKNPRNVEVETVNDITYLADGAIEIHRLKPTGSSATPHAADMLVVYVPEYELIIQSDQLWNGDFMKVWHGYTYRSFTPQARVEIINNARYLLDYIEEKELKVSKIMAAHGGLSGIEELEVPANAVQ
ncbi:MBL fold metallo-hydrolase [Flavobacteriaceae bacterium M23B6Z8]